MFKEDTFGLSLDGDYLAGRSVRDHYNIRLNFISNSRASISKSMHQSQEGSYNLNPERVAEVINDLRLYVVDQPDGLVKISAEGRVLSISAKAQGNADDLQTPEQTLTDFDLADLVVSKKLILKINEHPRVAIPSAVLHSIGRKYQR